MPPHADMRCHGPPCHRCSYNTHRTVHLSFMVAHSTIRRFSRAGYTLVEMAVVLVVMAILAGSALARLTPGLESSRIRRAAGIISADLRYAQAMAARQHAPVVVIIQPSLQTYIIRDRGSATVFRQRELGQDTDYLLASMASSPTTSIEIFPNGASQNTTTITITLGSRTRQIRFSRVGYVRIL